MSPLVRAKPDSRSTGPERISAFQRPDAALRHERGLAEASYPNTRAAQRQTK